MLLVAVKMQQKASDELQMSAHVSLREVFSETLQSLRKGSSMQARGD